jgi:hypothetical protein
MVCSFMYSIDMSPQEHFRWTVILAPIWKMRMK